MTRLNMGIIGAGLLGRAVHLRILSQHPHVQLCAVADPSPESRAACQAIVPTAKFVDSHHDLLVRDDVQAVVIAVPTHLHAKLAIEALHAGKHVYLEKPLATSAEEGQHLIDVWKTSGLVGMVGLNYRFNPLIAQLKQLLLAGRIGKPLSVRTVFSTHSVDMPEWKRHRSTGGGVLLDLATHHVDLVRFLFDSEVVNVLANVRSVKGEQDTASLQMSLANGVDVQSFFSLASVQEHSIEIFGTGGKLCVSLYRSLTVQAENPTRSMQDHLQTLLAPLTFVRSLPYSLQKRRSPWHEPSFALALGQFIHGCQNGSSPAPTFDDGEKAEQVIDAAEQSADTGRWVSPAALVNSVTAATPAALTT